MRRLTPKSRSRLLLESLENRLLLAADSTGPVIIGDPPEIPECTLRAAMEESNALDGHQSIGFLGGGQPTTFRVNTNGDASDAAPGDGKCETGAVLARLRPFNTIRPQSPLPVIIEEVSILGHRVSNYHVGIEVNGTDAGHTSGFVINETKGVPTVGSMIAGLAITHFEIHGIEALTGYNHFTGNHIGTTRDGEGLASNLEHGIHITSDWNSVGNDGGAVYFNVISGNLGDGVRISAGEFNDIQGNYIGTNMWGEFPIPNGGHGIHVTGAAGFTFVGHSPTADVCAISIGGPEICNNVVSGNLGNGIHMDAANADGSPIVANFVGTSRFGEFGIPNNHGIYLKAVSDTEIAGNLVSGNDLQGIYLDGAGTARAWITDNKVGTTLSTNDDIPNDRNGLYLRNTTDVIIGVDVSDGVRGDGNVISGNAQNGIRIINGSGHSIDGNRIGVNDRATMDVGNGHHGILITGRAANGMNIGGPFTIVVPTDARHPAERNVISGNSRSGIFINTGVKNIEVMGNLIGVGYDPIHPFRLAPLGNTQYGVVIRGSENTIGVRQAADPDADEGNIIGANTLSGVQIQGSLAKNNRIAGNQIGATENNLLGNGRHGVHVRLSASENWIGAAVGESEEEYGNSIGFNGMDGVYIEEGTKNSIRLNSIFENDDLGIDLKGGDENAFGVTANDVRVQDADTGANDLQNYPSVLTVSSKCGDEHTTHGVLDSAASTQYVIDLYSVNELDPSHHGEGRTFIESITVTTDADGFAEFESDSLGQDAFVVATATDPDGNTSEFSHGHSLLISFEASGDTTRGGDFDQQNPDGKKPDGTEDPTEPKFDGGCRLFPGAKELTSHDQGRNRVVVTAQIKPSAENVPVFFRAFDVDDPEDMDTAIDPTAAGYDNRGGLAGTELDEPDSHGAPDGFSGRLREEGTGDAFTAEDGILELMTDANGKIRVEFATSFAAGDNFRVLSSLDRPSLEQLDRADDVPTIGKIDGFGGAATDQLSIWRRFHMEQDVMATTEGDHDDGATAGAPVGVGGGRWRVATDIDLPQTNSYEGGWLRAGGHNYAIVSNTMGPGSSVVVVGMPPEGAIEVFEDDYTAMAGMNPAPTVRVDTESDDHVYDYMKVAINRDENRFADAYVVPEYNALDEFDSGARGQAKVDAETHIPDGGHAAHVDPFRGADASETPVFWVTYFTTGYQGDADNDPDGSGGRGGVTSNDEASTTYLETVRDRFEARPAGSPVGSVAEFIARVSVHEVGHQFDLDHTAGTLMNSNAEPVADDDFYFSGNDIDHIRRQQNSPGTHPRPAGGDEPPLFAGAPNHDHGSDGEHFEFGGNTTRAWAFVFAGHKDERLESTWNGAEVGSLSPVEQWLASSGRQATESSNGRVHTSPSKDAHLTDEVMMNQINWRLPQATLA